MDWIKVEKNLRDKAEVVGMSSRLKRDRDLVVGKLVCVWSWADGVTENGTVVHVDRDFIDQLTGIPGFAQAMIDVDWLECHENSIRIPNFDRHLGNNAKKRANNTTRQRVSRECRAESVTEARPEKKRREKRRVEEIKDTKTCSEPASPPAEPNPDVIELEFPITGPGSRIWILYRSKVAEYAGSFPSVDVLAMFRHARQWCIDNPAKRKTAKGMPAFLSRWIANNQNRGANYGGDGRRGDLGPTSRLRSDPVAKDGSVQAAADDGAAQGDSVAPQATPDRPNRLRFETGDP